MSTLSEEIKAALAEELLAATERGRRQGFQLAATALEEVQKNALAQADQGSRAQVFGEAAQLVRGMIERYGKIKR